MDNKEVPEQFLCPITGEIMQNPVVVDDGHTFQREAIVMWFSSQHYTNPVTNLKLRNLDLRPNFAIKSLIDKFKGKKEKVEFSQEAQNDRKNKIKEKINVISKTNEVKNESQPGDWIKNMQKQSSSNKSPWAFNVERSSYNGSWQNWGSQSNNQGQSEVSNFFRSLLSRRNV